MLEWGRRSGGAVEIVSDGDVVATTRPSAIRERAGATVDGSDWSYYKQQGQLLGERVGSPLPTLRASRPSIMRQAWEVEADGRTYRIEPVGLLQTRYRVLRDGAEIGESRKVGFWSNRPTLEVEHGTPLEHQVFLLWIAFIMRRRAAAAANSGGGGGGG